MGASQQKGGPSFAGSAVGEDAPTELLKSATSSNPICGTADVAVSLGRETTFLVGNCLLDKSCRARRPTGLPTVDGMGRKERPRVVGAPSFVVVLRSVLRCDC